MDEIEKRLRETSETCFNCYEAWQKNKKDSDVRESLQEAIHELRKVASRLEIELAISERDEMAQKPIPIPPHRDSKRRSVDENDHQPGNYVEDFDNNNNAGGHQQQSRGHQQQQRHRRGPRRHGGGGGGQQG